MIKKILIVEDEMIIAASLQIYLEELGYEIIDIATSVEESMSVLNTQKPDLALLDINLAQGRQTFGGISVAKYIQSLNIPFMFITSYACSKVIDMAEELSPIGYLLKPISKKTLLSQLEILKNSCEL